MESFPLDQLPMLCIEAIAKYLSTSDLAALCAVSHGFREAFDIEGVWKRHYNEERVKYLLETPCKVEPGFVHPETHKGDLSPMSEWRLSFIVENHLHNNWRQGKYKREVITSGSILGYGWCNGFLSSDCLVVAGKNRIKIFDMRNYPATHAVEPIPIAFETYSNFLGAEDKLVVLYNEGVEVYELNFITKQWNVKHSFFINEHEALSDGNKEMAKKYNDNSPSAMCVIINHYLVAFLQGEPTFHIWNIETGVKVKEESSSVKNSTILDISHSNTNLIVVVKQNNCFLFLAYNLAKLIFLPFKVKTQSTNYKYCVFGDFISIWTDGQLHIYNYLSNETIQCNYYLQTFQLEPFRDGIIFLHDKVLTVFRHSTGFKDLSYNVRSFRVVSDKFIQVWYSRSEGHTVYPQSSFPTIVEVCSTNTLRKTSLRLAFSTHYLTNKNATIVKERFANRLIWHFW